MKQGAIVLAIAIQTCAVDGGGIYILTLYRSSCFSINLEYENLVYIYDLSCSPRVSGGSENSFPEYFDILGVTMALCDINPYYHVAVIGQYFWLVLRNCVASLKLQAQKHKHKYNT